MMKYHIGLGSNTGDRESNLLEATHLLKKHGLDIVKESSVYETSPVGNMEQPWFLNQVLEVRSNSNPRALLHIVLGIEKSMGRTRTSPKGPRCIDIDILLAEDMIVQSADLNIPHPELANRNFVLAPLNEIACDSIHPLLGEKIGDLWRGSSDQSIVRLYNPA